MGGWVTGAWALRRPGCSPVTVRVTPAHGGERGVRLRRLSSRVWVLGFSYPKSPRTCTLGEQVPGACIPTTLPPGHVAPGLCHTPPPTPRGPFSLPSHAAGHGGRPHGRERNPRSPWRQHRAP